MTPNLMVTSRAGEGVCTQGMYVRMECVWCVSMEYMVCVGCVWRCMCVWRGMHRVWRGACGEVCVDRDGGV